MSVVFVPVTKQVPKEGKEVIDLFVGIVSGIKAGKSLVEIASGELPQFYAAVQGFQSIPEELRSEGNDELVGYAAGEFAAVLKPQSAPVPAA